MLLPSCILSPRGLEKPSRYHPKHAPRPWHTGLFFMAKAHWLLARLPQLPHTGLALAPPASPAHHQLLSFSHTALQPLLPANMVSASSCHLPGHISAAPKMLQLFREAVQSRKGSQPQKKTCSLKGCSSFTPVSKHTKK